MQVILIEDEQPAANRLTKLLQQLEMGITVQGHFDSIESSVAYFQSADTSVDLVFMDIQLADGLSFDIFTQVAVTAPVIFTTAFDQYTLKAFKVNSVDYLLKPIDEDELRNAVEKYRQLYHNKKTDFSEKILQLMQQMKAGRYKERLMIKRGQQLSYLKTESMAYCYADGKLCFAVDFTGNKFLLESNLTQLEEQLNPTHFYRINRHLLVNIESVKKVHTWLGGRLKIEIQPGSTAETIVSRERVNGFKDWLGQ